jgi:alcohol dehydrogenase
MSDDRFRFEFDAPVLRSGSGAAGEVGAELAEHGFERALVVCGSTVGRTPAVVDPVEAGLGDRLVGVFAETTPEKRLATAYDGLAAARRNDADVLVGLGGGSSLDVAKVVSLLSADDREPEAVGRELAETGTISAPSDPLLPVVAVPTTLAGAGISNGAGVTASPASGLVSNPANGGVSDPRLMPAAVVYDSRLFATTPRRVLAASAMNGFDKGIEALYARNRTPVTDATAARGLELLTPGLRRLGTEQVDDVVLDPVVEGTMVVQYGVSRPDGTMLSILHAFGHGLTRAYDVQQGAAHGVVAPHVLRYVFDEVDGRRELLADALGVGDASDPAAAVVERVETVRDALSLPTRLRDVEGPEPDEFESVAEAVVADSFVANAPPGLDPTVADVVAVLREAY